MKSGIIDHDVTQKLSSAAKEIGDVLNNFGASMFGGSNKKSGGQERHIGGDVGKNLNFSDDDDEHFSHKEPSQFNYYPAHHQQPYRE